MFSTYLTQTTKATYAIPWTIRIDYDRGDQGSYRAVVVEANGAEIFRSNTGNPPRDYIAAIFWSAVNQAPGLQPDTSCYEFPYDGERYGWAYNKILQTEVLTVC